MSKPKVIITRKWPAGAEAKAKELFDIVLNEEHGHVAAPGLVVGHGL